MEKKNRHILVYVILKCKKIIITVQKKTKKIFKWWRKNDESKIKIFNRAEEAFGRE